MLIIMGTSLKVHGFKKLVKDFAKAVHESAPLPSASTSSPKNAKALAGKVIFVNKTAPGAEWDGIIDYHVVGDTDKWAERVLEEWRRLRPADWEVQTKLTAAGDAQTAGAFKVSKEITNTFDAVKGRGQSSRVQVRLTFSDVRFQLAPSEQQGSRTSGQWTISPGCLLYLRHHHPHLANDVRPMGTTTSIAVRRRRGMHTPNLLSSKTEGCCSAVIPRVVVETLVTLSTWGRRD